jgi:hypothetical protein
VRWLSRHPALALLAATVFPTPVVFLPATVNGQETNVAETSSPKVIVLNPQQIVITLGNDFQLSRGPTWTDRAVKIIENQIEQKRAAELEKASSQGAFWGARFWDYLPKGSGSLNSPVTDIDEDDPFITPSYLMLANKSLDRQIAESEARSRLFFSK